MVGITINKIEQMGYNIFDFDYDWENVSYFGVPITKETLESDFKDYYAYYNIAYETIESFKFELKRKWKKLIRAYNNILKTQPDIKLNESERIYTENNEGGHTDNSSASLNHTSETLSNGDDKFSDTPNQYVDNDETDMYLTNREITKNSANVTSQDQSESNSERTSSNKKDITETLTGNEYEKYMKIREFVEDMEYKFFDKFNDLFEMLIRIGNLYKVRRYPWMINI